jgi:hypothetical protein
MVLDEETEVAGPYKVHVSGTTSELTGEIYCNFNVPDAEHNTHARYPR